MHTASVVPLTWQRRSTAAIACALSWSHLTFWNRTQWIETIRENSSALCVSPVLGYWWAVTVAQLLSFSMVDIGDGRVETWWCAASCNPVLGGFCPWRPSLPYRRNKNCIRRCLDQQNIYVDPQTYMSVYLSVFLQVDVNIDHLLWGGEVRVDTLPNCTRNQVILSFLHEKISLQICVTL